MPEVFAFRGIRFDPSVVGSYGAVLAPPYDVISPRLQQELYARDLRNIVRVDFGMTYPDDDPPRLDRYVRARQHLAAWQQLGIVTREDAPAVYVVEHEFTDSAGVLRRRVGLLAEVAAAPWTSAPMKPHERTLRGPKEDRLALLRETRMHTSPVFGLWHGVSLAQALGAITATPPLAVGAFSGEFGTERVRLWRVDGSEGHDALLTPLRDATLYVADGHHRYETAAAAGATRCLVYLCDSHDPNLVILPTHRLIAAPPARDLRSVADSFDLTDVGDLPTAVRAAAEKKQSHHAFVAMTPQGVTLMTRERRATAARESLDPAVLEQDVLRPLGFDGDALTNGALTYTRSLDAVAAAVRSGDAAMGFALLPCTVDEVLAVADDGDTMPQKSTYFYPKVPTGLVLAPVGQLETG